jgi:hypothetical protein
VVWKVGMQRWRGGTKSLAGKDGAQDRMVLLSKINGAELESLGAPNMEVLLAKNKKKLGKDMGRANF